MAYTRPFIRATFGGTTASGGDIWSCNFSIADYGTTPTAFPDFFETVSDRIEDLALAVSNYISDVATKVPDDVTLGYLKLAPIGTDGKYLFAATEYEISDYGSQAGPYVPQASMVNTLVSDKWKDPGKYNRFYLPFGTAAGGVWCMNDVEQQSYVSALRVFILALNTVLEGAAEDGPGLVSVVSDTALGYISPVMSVRVGRIIDTQRRRRNQLSELYRTLEVIPPA